MDEQTGVYKDHQTQAMLNQPLKNAAGNSQEDENFLDLILALIAEGKIDLYKPSSLINTAIYDRLVPEQQAKIEVEAMSMLATIREIKGLCDAEYRETFQVENLVRQLRMGKERLEEAGGDLFVI